MKIIIAGFNQTFKSLFFVFTKITIYFGLYFIGLFLIALFFFSNTISSLPISQIVMIPNFLCNIFIFFVVPYYAYKYNNKGANIKPFWTFLGKTVLPVIINYIKLIFVVLLFFLLLIIPGIYKGIRLTFFAQTVFFDDIYKQNQMSALKAANHTTQGYFWLIGLFLSLCGFFSLLWGLILGIFGMFHFSSSFPSLILTLSLLCANMYFMTFIYLFMNQFYLELKKHRMESVSL